MAFTEDQVVSTAKDNCDCEGERGRDQVHGSSRDWGLMVGTVFTVLMAADFFGNDSMPGSPNFSHGVLITRMLCDKLSPDFHDNRPCWWNKASVNHFLQRKTPWKQFSKKITCACSNEFEMSSQNTTQNTKYNYILLCLFSHLHRKHHEFTVISSLQYLSKPVMFQV